MYDIAFLDLPALRAAGGTVQLPGSKSISNRVLLLAALAQGTTEVHDLLDSDDTRITGLGGQLKEGARQAELFLGNAGTAMRPLTAALALLGGEFKLSGVPRMHERPIGDLVDALRGLGCGIDYTGQPGFPPLRLQGATGGMLRTDNVTDLEQAITAASQVRGEWRLGSSTESPDA